MARLAMRFIMLNEDRSGVLRQGCCAGFSGAGILLSLDAAHSPGDGDAADDGHPRGGARGAERHPPIH